MACPNSDLMGYLGTVWLERWSSSSLLSFLTSLPTLPCNRGECTNLQQLLSEAGFGWQLFQETSETGEGDTPQHHCLCFWQLRTCVTTAVWSFFNLYFVLHQWFAPECILKQNQLLGSVPTQTSFQTKPRTRHLLRSRMPEAVDFKINY